MPFLPLTFSLISSWFRRPRHSPPPVDAPHLADLATYVVELGSVGPCGSELELPPALLSTPLGLRATA
jgi:hypothetical protein